jgi:hypothetical protein
METSGGVHGGEWFGDRRRRPASGGSTRFSVGVSFAPKRSLKAFLPEITEGKSMTTENTEKSRAFSVFSVRQPLRALCEPFSSANKNLIRLGRNGWRWRVGRFPMTPLPAFPRPAGMFIKTQQLRKRGKKRDYLGKAMLLKTSRLTISSMGCQREELMMGKCRYIPECY